MGSIMSKLDYSDMGFAQMKKGSRAKKTAMPDTSNLDVIKKPEATKIWRNEMQDLNFDDIGWDEIDGEEATGIPKTEDYVKINLEGKVKFGIGILEQLGYTPIDVLATEVDVDKHKATPEGKQSHRNMEGKLQFPMEVGDRLYRVKQNGVDKVYHREWGYIQDDKQHKFETIGVSKTKKSAKELVIQIRPAVGIYNVAAKIPPKNRDCKLTGEQGEQIEKVIEKWYTTETVPDKSGDPTKAKDKRVSAQQGKCLEEVYKFDNEVFPYKYILDPHGKKELVKKVNDLHDATAGRWLVEGGGVTVDKKKGTVTLALDKVEMIYENPPIGMPE